MACVFLFSTWVFQISYGRKKTRQFWFGVCRIARVVHMWLEVVAFLYKLLEKIRHKCTANILYERDAGHRKQEQFVSRSLSQVNSAGRSRREGACLLKPTVFPTIPKCERCPSIPGRGGHFSDGAKRKKRPCVRHFGTR